jgi:nucleotide-binding universal stress UspA family protein
MADRARAEVVALLVTSENRDPVLDRYEARCFLREHGGRKVDVSLDPVRDVADAIATHAHKASTLVCMSSHGRNALGELTVGSVAAAVERQRTGPVMLVGPEVTGWRGPRSLLVCCDDSNAAATLVPVVRDWCEAMDLRSEVVHVQAPGERPGTRAAIRIAAALDAPVTLRVGSVPAWTIAELAADRPGAVVMVATATTGRMARLLRGSTTRALVAKSPVPVVAVPIRPGLE